MPNLSIKDVPEAWAEALRQRAARNHRSLQGELMAIVGHAVSQTHEERPLQSVPSREGRVRIVGYDAAGFPIVRQGWKTVEQLTAEIDARGSPRIHGQKSSVELIREDRDSR
jgi:plasmid stability protein